MQRRPTWISLSDPETLSATVVFLERVTEESDRQQIINLLAEGRRSKKTLAIAEMFAS